MSQLDTPKARWFLSLGYRAESADHLENDLLKLVRNSSEYEVEKTPYGVKYVVVGRIKTPNGRFAHVRTVWAAEASTTRPRLVTAYPDEGSDND